MGSNSASMQVVLGKRAKSHQKKNQPFACLDYPALRHGYEKRGATRFARVRSAAQCGR